MFGKLYTHITLIEKLTPVVKVKGIPCKLFVGKSKIQKIKMKSQP